MGKDIDGTKVPKCLASLSEFQALYFIYAEACFIKRCRYWNWTALISHAFAGVTGFTSQNLGRRKAYYKNHIDIIYF